MFLDASTLEAMAIVGGMGAIGGLIGGFVASADSLFGSVLVGIIGGVALSAILAGAGAPALYGVGEQNFSMVWGGIGGLLLGYVVGRSNV